MTHVFAGDDEEDYELEEEDLQAAIDSPQDSVNEGQQIEVKTESDGIVIGTITHLNPDHYIAVTERPIDARGNFYCVVANCTENFSSMQGLKYHLTNVHNKTLVYKCSGCDELFPNARDRNNHQKTHTENVTYCKFCTYNTVHRNDVQRHEKKCPENPDLKWMCTYCSKNRKFTSDKALFNHLKSTHKLKGDYLCVYCKELFGKATELGSHKCTIKRKYLPK